MSTVGTEWQRELKILIVEDVPRDAEAIEQELRNESIRFQSRRLDTREAFLREMKNFAPDIVLSDFTMPEFDALEALRLLKEHQYDTPFILVTGTRSEEVAVECLKEGADDYILKASLKRLPSSVVNVLQKKEAERQKAQAEAALRRSEEQFRLITENSNDLICLLDPDGRFLYASPSFHKNLGLVPEHLAGTSAFDLVHPADQAGLRGTLAEALKHRSGRTAELRLQHRAGDWLTFEAVANWMVDEQGRPQRAMVVSRDITRRKQSEELLRTLPQLIRNAQEAERRRVARELHDSVNQILAAAKFRIRSVEEKLLKKADATGEEALKARNMLDKAMQEVRRISRNLRPSELDDLGLAPAIRSLCADFSERTGIEVDLSFTRLPANFPPDVELNLYRILQEALNNIAKHACAKHATLSLVRQGDALHITLRDDGVGFDPQPDRGPTAPRAGMGLVDMAERTSFMGGWWKLNSTPGQGTEICLRIPLPNQTTPRNHARAQT